MPSPVTPPFTLVPGASATMTVTFTPTVSGIRTGSLNIVSNDPASPTSVSLSGSGTSGASGTPYVVLSGFTGTLTFPDTVVE